MSRGRGAAAELARLLTDRDRSSLFGVLAMREMDSDTYLKLGGACRAEGLLDALRRSVMFNAWGLAHVWWTGPRKR